ncbi:MAG: hypothetical protein N2487_02745 [Verrucomicrobiae bacterium]|nr:hypothetical protein [Verrucomicrobiae bacterium]
MAASSAKDVKDSSQAKLRGRPFYGVVKAVDILQGFVVLEGRGGQRFFVSPQTTIKIDGVNAKLKDVEAGKYVGGYAREESAGRLVATTLNIYSDRAKTGSKKEVGE